MTVPRMLVAAGLLLLASDVRSQDPQAAERQYRIARRLAAEGSPEAAQALRRVVELDPAGPLADDALIEQALLERLPRWPEGLGALEPDPARRAAALLQRVLDRHGADDRAHEARYYRGLLRLEPLDSHDASAARLDLLALATSPDGGAWGQAARYLVAWLAEQQGDLGAARAAYQRLVIETPDGGATASRARLGLARLDLAQGRPGPAAAGIQAALADEATPRTAARSLRTLAVGALLREAGAPAAPPAPEVVTQTGVRALAGFRATPDGGLLVADRREGVVLAFDAGGAVRARWEVAGVQAVAVNALGRIAVAADGRLLRLAPDRSPLPVAALGSLGSVSAMAMDALGGVWLLDRGGARIERIEPGASKPVPFWESGGAKLSALVFDGRRLVGIDDRSRTIVAVAPSGARPIGVDGLRRPAAVTSDPTGRLAILDTKLGEVVFVEPDGTRGAAVSLDAAGIEKPLAADLGRDGALHLFDGASGSWVRVP